MHWVKSFMPKHFWCFVRFFLVLLVSLFQLQKLMPMWSGRRLTMLPYFDGSSAGRGMWKQLLAGNRNRFNSINVNCQNPLRIPICLRHTDKRFIYSAITVFRPFCFQSFLGFGAIFICLRFTNLCCCNLGTKTNEFFSVSTLMIQEDKKSKNRKKTMICQQSLSAMTTLDQVMNKELESETQL